MTGAMEKNWCADFYDDLFAEHHLRRTEEGEMNAVIRFLEDKLRLKAGDTVFDQCCGVGSLSIALAKRGYKPVGVDLIPSYVSWAAGDAKEAGVTCHFDCGDAYAYVTPAPCDAAINWWTSFGYSADDAENVRMLARACDSLKPGAWFSLDYMNGPKRERDLKAQAVIREEIRKADCTIAWESRLDTARRMVVKTWFYEGKDGTKSQKAGGGAKVYTADELMALFSRSGFGDTAAYGSIEGEPFSESSPRCIIVGRKRDG